MTYVNSQFDDFLHNQKTKTSHSLNKLLKIRIIATKTTTY